SIGAQRGACLPRPIERRPAPTPGLADFTPEVPLLVPLQLGVVQRFSAVFNGGCPAAQRASESLKGPQRKSVGHLLRFWCGVRAPGGPQNCWWDPVLPIFAVRTAGVPLL